MENKAVLKNSPLFYEIEEANIEAMLGCLGAVRRSCRREEFIFHSQDRVEQIGLVLSGRALIIKEDIWGNRMLLGEAKKGMLFGEAYACSGSKLLEVSVIAEADMEILFLNVRKILQTCPSACEFHGKLIKNLLSCVAERNLALMQKIEHMSRKTLREKLMSYLSAEAAKNGKEEFTISFDRQQLAEYLSADRSALSAELGRMRRDGLLEFRKNRFCLKNVKKDGI